MITIRPERPEDVEPLYQVYGEAFGQDQEALLMRALWANGGLLLSLVACCTGIVLGGVAFSSLDLKPIINQVHLAGLAPLAVLLAYQRRGIGSRLVQVGEACPIRAGAVDLRKVKIFLLNREPES
jgi:putative acetyltransferase